MYKISYMGDGSTTEFNFNFPFYENTNIIVTVNGTSATGYSVIGTQGGDNADIPFIGGKVIFDVAPISTDSITISRSLPLTRIVDYQPTEKINPTILNQDQNYTMEVLKDFNDKLDDIDEKYSEIINTESTQILINKINEFLRQINYLDTATSEIGGIPGISSNILDLNEQTAEIPNKLDKTLDNLPNTSKQQLIHLCMPDYSRAYSVPKGDANNQNTASTDGYLVFRGVASNADKILFIDNKIVAYAYSSEFGCITPIAKGSKYYLIGPSETYFNFIPTIGS